MTSPLPLARASQVEPPAPWPIPSSQVWRHLSKEQQRTVLGVLVKICRELTTTAPQMMQEVRRDRR